MGLTSDVMELYENLKNIYFSKFSRSIWKLSLICLNMYQNKYKIGLQREQTFQKINLYIMTSVNRKTFSRIIRYIFHQKSLVLLCRFDWVIHQVKCQVLRQSCCKITLFEVVHPDCTVKNFLLTWKNVPKLREKTPKWACLII